MKKVVAAMAALSFAFCTAAAAVARPIGLDDFKTIAGVSDAQISPDGKLIAYVVTRNDYKTDRGNRTLMLYDLSTGSQRSLTIDRNGLGDPAWSPDGTRLAFEALAGEGSEAREQVFVLNLNGGDSQAATSAKAGVEEFAWRPDGNAIAYVTPDAPANAAQIKHHLDGFSVGDQAFDERSAPAPNHIWLASRDANGTWSSQRLTHGSWSLPSAQPPGPPASPLSWSPDGRSIAFEKMADAHDADSWNAVAAVLDAQTKTVRVLTAHGKYESVPLYSPDGSKIAYWYPFGGDPAAQNDIVVTSSAGGNGDDVTSTDPGANIVRALWMPDSRHLLLAGHSGTDAALWLKPLSGVAKRLNLGTVQPAQSFWLDASVANTGAIAFTGSESKHPSELYYLASTDAKPKRLTSYNDATADLDLGNVVPIAWNSEGFSEDGTLTYPPDYDKIRATQSNHVFPLVLVVHGGPASASITSFSAFNQLLAARGWIVFNPNYRGSDNLGEKYWYGIVKDAGDGPGRDVMAGIKAVEAQAPIDSKRIAVSGWSYGGYMTSWLTGHYHIWKAAVAGAAVNNLVDEYTLSDGAGAGEGFQLGGSPFVGSTINLYREQSPITYAWQIDTPTLIMADVDDARVPITQSYEMYHALKDHHVPVRFFAYPVAGHYPSDPVRSLNVSKRWLDWLARYLK
ncbi:MAG: S9 family peptidase [Candidatus Eremiobacteraeota bacterium]|nr:S9 family peptidase [Candidatus Eremiobacteraeota bacterium]